MTKLFQHICQQKGIHWPAEPVTFAFQLPNHLGKQLDYWILVKREVKTKGILLINDAIKIPKREGACNQKYPHNYIILCA